MAQRLLPLVGISLQFGLGLAFLEGGCVCGCFCVYVFVCVHFDQCGLQSSFLHVYCWHFDISLRIAAS